MSDRRPDYWLAKAVESTIVSAGISAFACHTSDPDRCARLIRQADRLEAKYTSERGEHYYETLKRGPR